MEEIICVLDKSGSMQGARDDAVQGFNEFIKEQFKINDANLTVVWFDDRFSIGYEGKLSDYKELEVWPSGGMTSLLDAIGKTFSHVQDRLSKEKPDKVIMAILTDGQENHSHEFTNETVKALITEHQDKYNWDVVFLAADQDAWGVAKDWGLKKGNVIDYDSMNTRSGFASYSSTVGSLRK